MEPTKNILRHIFKDRSPVNVDAGSDEQKNNGTGYNLLKKLEPDQDSKIPRIQPDPDLQP